MPQTAETQALRRFYEAFPHPAQPDDLDGLAAGTQAVLGNPRQWFHLFFPNQDYREELDVLVAGCGTDQAARLSLVSPKAHITAIDISEAALTSTRRLKARYGLDSLEVKELPLEDVSSMGQDFDLIYCTGVLHHLESPAEGLRALRGVLRPAGSMNLLFYGRHGRVGAEVARELMQRLGIRGNSEGVGKARRWIEALPVTHPFREFMAGTNYARSPEILAGDLLSPRDSEHSVSEVLGCLGDAGLHLQRFVSQAPYLPQCTLPADSDLLPLLAELPVGQQYEFMELFRSTMGRHDLAACRDDRPPADYEVDFQGPDTPRYVPILVPGVEVTSAEAGQGAVECLRWRAHEDPGLRLPLGADELRLFRSIDGRRDLAGVLKRAKMDGPNAEQRARSFLQALWEHDYILVKTPSNAPDSAPRNNKGHDETGQAIPPTDVNARPTPGATQSQSKDAISNDPMRIPYDSCPACDSRDFHGLREDDCTKYPLYREGMPSVIRWKRCHSCGHVFTEGYYTTEALETVLQRSHPHQTPGGQIDKQRELAAPIVSTVTSLQTHLGGRWLEVGFGSGALLATAAEYGYDAVGIDIRPPIVELMRSLGFEAVCRDFLAFNDEGGFDVISLCDVLEHLPFPREALSHAHKLLKPSGLLLISTPNMDSLVWKTLERQGDNPYWTEVEHYHIFSRERVYKMLREAGLEPCRYAISTHYLAGMEIIARRGSPNGAGKSAPPPAAPVKPLRTPAPADQAEGIRRLLDRTEGKPQRLNVGCGRNIKNGWINLDVTGLPGVDMVADLDQCAGTPLPLPDDSIDEFLLSHLVEHIRSPLPLMQELHRIAKPDARAVIRLPYGSSDDAFEDPTHVRQYFLNSFGYFCQPAYWRADYGYRGDWQPHKITLVVDSGTYAGVEPKTILKEVHSRRNVVREMIAELEAIKPIREPRRELLSPPAIHFRLA